MTLAVNIASAMCTDGDEDNDNSKIVTRSSILCPSHPIQGHLRLELNFLTHRPSPTPPLSYEDGCYMYSILSLLGYE